jgi:hypothetical protein
MYTSIVYVKYTSTILKKRQSGSGSGPQGTRPCRSPLLEPWGTSLNKTSWACFIEFGEKTTKSSASWMNRRVYSCLIRKRADPLTQKTLLAQVVRIPSLSPRARIRLHLDSVQKAFCTWITGSSLSPSSTQMTEQQSDAARRRCHDLLNGTAISDSKSGELRLLTKPLSLSLSGSSHYRY